MSTVTLAEIADVLERVYGWRASDVAEIFTGVLGLAVEVVTPTIEIAARAGALRARHYRRRANDVSLGDCFVLATARADDTIVTTDRALARTARAEGLTVIALPNARGRRP